jgi:streptomycin 6-kinase
VTTLIPLSFAKTITDVFDERGRLWLDNLPNLIADCEQRWSITIAPPFALTYNYVAPAFRTDGTPVVFKAGLPESTVSNEMEALRHWAGYGAVALLDSDPDAGVMLLETLQPGTPLVTIEDDEAATRIFAQVARQLWRPLPPQHTFDSVHRLAKGLSRLRTRYNGQTGPLPKALVETAETLFTELLASQAEPVLLHGDLHHWNILSANSAATREPWLAIDPQGTAGEPCYEVGAWLRNPLPGLFDKPNPERLLARRIDILTEALGFDRQRIIGWGLAQAVLSAWWSIEDHGEQSAQNDQGDGWQAAIRVAEILASLKL